MAKLRSIDANVDDGRVRLQWVDVDGAYHAVYLSVQTARDLAAELELAADIAAECEGEV